MLKLFLEMSMLAFESQQAIWLRSMKIAAGGTAAQTAAIQAATGAGPVGIARGYRRKVRNNVRRLSK